MKFNINDIARVKLTGFGLNTYNLYYSFMRLESTKLIDNILEAPVWEIMHIFGRYLFMGATNIIFVDNEIEIK